MADGSLVINIRTLAETLAGVGDLGGQFEAVATASGDLAGGVTEVEGELSGSMSGLLEFDAAGQIAAINDLLGSVEQQAQAADPTGALTSFEQRVAAADQAIAGDLLGQIQSLITAVEGIVAGIPENRTDLFRALVDQLLRILASLEGPEADTIRAWVQSVEDFHRDLMPLLEDLSAADDPSDLVVQVFQRSLAAVLDTLGYNSVRQFVEQLEAFLDTLLPPTVVEPVATGLDQLQSGFEQTLTLTAADYPQYRQAVVATSTGMQSLRQELRPLLAALNRVLETPLFQPNALETYLREQLEQALAVPIREAQRIEDPFNHLFDRLDAAIEGVDLGFVQAEVLDFFATTRETLEAVNLGSIGSTLQTALEPVEAVVSQLEGGVDELLGDVAGFFDGLVQQLRALAGGVGEFLPNGQFQYHFESDLRQMFGQAQAAIGDPNSPEAGSIAGRLADFQGRLEESLGQLGDGLSPLETSLTDVSQQAVQGIDQFAAFLNGLNIPQLLEDLRGRVADILDQLAPIDFAEVIDPVVEEMAAAADSLRQIDPEALNDLLKEALKAALDLVITIDLSGSVTPPLRSQFQQIKQVPQTAIAALQQGYEQALELLETLHPEQLLAALLSAFEVIESAIARLDLSQLLAPLDRLHEQYLQQPLASLQPSTLLQPLSAPFQAVTTQVDQLDSAQVIAPLTQRLDQLKATVTGLDLSRGIDQLLGQVQQLQQGLEALRPSELLQPLAEDFARLETELDRVKPSVLFQPAVELAAPLVARLEDVQASVAEALYELFQAPLTLLDQLQPQALNAQIHQAIDAVLAALQRLNLPGRFNQLKAQHFDLRLAVEAEGSQAKLALVANLDPQAEIGDLVALYNRLVTGLEGLKQTLDLQTLDALYGELRERLLAMLPPYARQLLDVATFRRVMRRADPTRFLTDLDQRFEALKTKLLPIRPETLGAELDTTYEAVLALLDDLALEESLNQVKAAIGRIQTTVTDLRVDFLAADIDQAIAQVQALVSALDPTRMAAELDERHQQLLSVVAATQPSQLLSGLNTLLDQVKGLLNSVNPRLVLEEPLLEAWAAIDTALNDIDVTVVLMPLVDKLDQLQGEFESSLDRTEDAFDDMLRAARGALSGSGTASGGVSL